MLLICCFLLCLNAERFFSSANIESIVGALSRESMLFACHYENLSMQYSEKKMAEKNEIFH